jgi:hypothetical protein
MILKRRIDVKRANFGKPVGAQFGWMSKAKQGRGQKGGAAKFTEN